MRHLGIAPLLCSVLVACTSADTEAGRLAIAPGQTRDAVASLMGPPADRQFMGKEEVWQYCSTNMFVDDFLAVWFYDGRVAGMQSYKNTEGGDCTRYMRDVNWETAPDAIIELRNR